MNDLIVTREPVRDPHLASDLVSNSDYYGLENVQNLTQRCDANSNSDELDTGHKSESVAKP